MSDYTQIVNFTTKDGLTTGDPAKLAKGTEIDAELSAISTAIATKYDGNDIASTAEARALTLDTVLITPSGLNDVLTENAGVLGELQSYTDPGADTVYGWDDSAGATIGFTLGTGITSSGTTLRLGSDAAGDGIDYSAGVLSLTDISAGANNPVNLSGTTWSFDITALGSLTDGSDLSGTDTIVVDNGGTAKKLQVQDMGMRVQSSQTTQTLAASDMNSIMVFTGTATLTLPNSDLSIGAPVVVKNTHASQDVTIALAASATLNSVNHSTATSVTDTVKPGGTALIYQTASGTWHLTGDIED